MRWVVVDTSSLLRLFIPDGPIPEGLEADLARAHDGEAVLLAPELLLAEAAQVLRKKENGGQLSATDSDRILDAIRRLPLEVVGHRDILIDALDLARAHGLTAYDALFLALACQTGADLTTCDKKLRAAFGRATLH